MTFVRRTPLLLLPLVALAGCMERDLPTEVRFAEGTPSLAIVDAPRGGTTGFYWLPPMVPQPSPAGAFDAALSPLVQICVPAGNGCGTVIATYSMNGQGAERIRVDEADEHYIVNWRPSDTGARVGQMYRIRALVGEVVLGHADARVVRDGREASRVDATQYVAVIHAQTLPIRFRIESGIPGAVVVTPAEALLTIGETQLFTATVSDLHGNALPVPVGWSSSDGGVATVDGSGLATAAGAGQTEIRANAGPASGSAMLVVEAPAPTAGWHPIGGGMNGWVTALVVHEGELVAGGRFTQADGQTVNRIARWSGSGWEPLGSGMNHHVTALGVHEGELIAGGHFTQAGGQTVNHVARWSGTAWEPLGSGMNRPVRALVVHEGELIAGGDFTQADGQTVNYVARWSGTAWEPLGSGMNSDVSQLVVHEGKLIAGGTFTEAGGQTANRIARWSGTGWEPLGSGMNHYVTALVVHEGELVAGGWFTQAGGQTAIRIARWSGSGWEPLGSGMSNAVRALVVHEGELIAGGDFSQAGGQTVNHVARWGLP